MRSMNEEREVGVGTAVPAVELARRLKPGTVASATVHVVVIGFGVSWMPAPWLREVTQLTPQLPPPPPTKFLICCAVILTGVKFEPWTPDKRSVDDRGAAGGRFWSGT